MSATVEHIRQEIDQLAPEEARELFANLQRDYSVQIVASPDDETDSVASIDAEWDAELDARIKDIEQGKVQLISGDEFERNTAALFAELGIPRQS
jgi:hypothetical protein